MDIPRCGLNGRSPVQAALMWPPFAKELSGRFEGTQQWQQRAPLLVS